MSVADGTGQINFVGRGSQLRELLSRVDDAAARRPSTVLLGGEAGVGKSRLIREFVGAATDRDPGMHVLSGGCVNLGEGVVPYAPLIDALRRLVRERGADHLSRYGGPAFVELNKLIADFTGTGQPVASTAEPNSQTRVFGAVLRMLDHLGANAPTVLIFEDLHWADPSTVDLVSYLVQSQTDERVLPLFSYRSAVPETTPLWTLMAEPSFRRRIHAIELPTFTQDELAQFLGARAEDPEFLKRCFELSDGNPLFAEELIDGGVLLGRELKQLPRSLTDIMVLLLRQLDDDATEVIRVAATAGRTVGHDLLATVCDLDRKSLNAALRQCVKHRVLVVDQTDDDTYTFRHALMREAVLEDLLPGERRQLHAAIAEALTDDPGLSLVDGPTAAADLAHHWFEARKRPQALRTAVVAAGAAEQVRAFRVAQKQYSRVLTLWPQVDDAERQVGQPRDRILSAAAEAARWAGDLTGALELLGQAVAQVDEAGDPDRAGELLERLGSYRWETGELDVSHAAYTRAAELLSGRPHTAVTARVAAALATAMVQSGHYTEGVDEATRAVGLARSVGARAEEGRALNTLGTALTMLDRADEGIPHLEQAVRIARELDHLEDRQRAYGNLTIALEHAGRLTEAADVAKEEFDRVAALGLHRTKGADVLVNNASAPLVQLGRWGEATTMLQGVLRDRGVRETRYPRLTLAEIYVARGRFAEARRLLTEVREVAGLKGDPRLLGPLHCCVAELAIWERDLAAADAGVVAGLAAVAGTENSLSLLRLCATGLRAAADATVLATDRSEPAAPEIPARIAELVAAAGAGPAPPDGSERGTWLWWCLAERDRAAGADTPAQWTAIAGAWETLERPYLAAYAHWRVAEAALAVPDVKTAAAAARSAHRIAEELDAEPLRRRVTATATNWRLDLTDAPPPEATPIPQPRDPWGLTRQELRVLRLVVEGKTNKQIAEALSITAATAGVHVSNIIRKLGVENRGSAAAMAGRAHLFAE